MVPDTLTFKMVTVSFNPTSTIWTSTHYSLLGLILTLADGERQQSTFESPKRVPDR